MKFQIGQRVYLWIDNGEHAYDGTLLEIIGWKRESDGIYYRCDNLSTDLPMYHPEGDLVSSTEYQGFVRRVLNGDLQETSLNYQLTQPFWNFRHYRGQWKGTKS